LPDRLMFRLDAQGSKYQNRVRSNFLFLFGHPVCCGPFRLFFIDPQSTGWRPLGVVFVPHYLDGRQRGLLWGQDVRTPSHRPHHKPQENHGRLHIRSGGEPGRRTDRRLLVFARDFAFALFACGSHLRYYRPTRRFRGIYFKTHCWSQRLQQAVSGSWRVSGPCR